MLTLKTPNRVFDARLDVKPEASESIINKKSENVPPRSVCVIYESRPAGSVQPTYDACLSVFPSVRRFPTGRGCLSERVPTKSSRNQKPIASRISEFGQYYKDPARMETPFSNTRTNSMIMASRS